MPDTEGFRAGVLLLAAQFPGQSHGEVLDTVVEAAVAAERAGFDDVWFAEHHFMSYGVCPSAVTLAAYVLGQTSRIEVGTAVSVLSVNHPVALAEQAALLDQVSSGRFWLGVGRGGPWVDLEVFGTGLPMLLGLHAGDDHKREMAACYSSAAPPDRPLPGHIAAVVAYVADTRTCLASCLAPFRLREGVLRFLIMIIILNFSPVWEGATRVDRGADGE